MKISEKYDFHEARCEICGKYIWMPDPEIWAYKIVNPARHRDWYCCSWHCFRQMPEKPIRGRKSGLKDKIFDLLKQGARPVDMHACDRMHRGNGPILDRSVSGGGYGMRLIDVDKLKQAILTIMPERSEVLLVVDQLPVYITQDPVVTCKDCKYRFVDGDNVRFNMCLLNHNRVQTAIGSVLTVLQRT